MKFNPHLELIGRHATFSPSQYHWLNYDDEKLVSRYESKKAVERGDILHAYAKTAIEMGKEYGIRPARAKKTFNMYVNDAIGFKMVPEQPLYYSEDYFGTCDSISELSTIYRTKVLRIHDLKTGETPAHMEQLEVYAALFCLEYQFDPKDLEIELRIYQSDDIRIENPEPELIQGHMNKIVNGAKIIEAHKAGE